MLHETKNNLDSEEFIYNNMKKTIEHTNLSLRKQKINSILSKKRTLLHSNINSLINQNETTDKETLLINNIYNAFILSNESLLETHLTQFQRNIISNKNNLKTYQIKIQTNSNIPSDIFTLIPEIFFRYYNNELISYLTLTSLTVMTSESTEMTQRLSDANIIQRFLQIITTNFFLKNIVHIQHILKIIGNVIIDMFDTIELIKIYEETTLLKDLFRIIATIQYCPIDKEQRNSISINYVLEFINSCIWLLQLYLDSNNKTSNLPKDEVVSAMNSLCNDCILNYHIYEKYPYSNMELLLTQLETLSNKEEYLDAILESGFLSTITMLFEFLFDDGNCSDDDAVKNNKILSTDCVHKIISIIANILALPNEKVAPYYTSDISLIIEKLIMRYKIHSNNNNNSNIQETLLLLFGNLCCFNTKPEITTLISDEMVVSTLFKYYAKNRNNLNELCFVIYNVFYVQSVDIVMMYIKFNCFDVLMDVFKDEKNYKEALNAILKGFEGGLRLGIINVIVKEICLRDFKREAENLLLKYGNEVDKNNEEMLNKFIEMYNKHSNLYFGEG